MGAVAAFVVVDVAELVELFLELGNGVGWGLNRLRFLAGSIRVPAPGGRAFLG